jgi:uncharacterized protein with PIN domain
VKLDNTRFQQEKQQWKPDNIIKKQRRLLTTKVQQLHKKSVHRILRFSLLDQASNYNFKKLLEVYDEMGNTKLH